MVLVAERQAYVAADRGAVQGDGAERELDGDQPKARPPDRRLGLGQARRAVKGDEPPGAERCLARRRVGRVSSLTAEPDALHAERGSGADDGPEIERLAHRLKQQADPAMGGAAPGPVQALDLGRSELTAHGLAPA